MTVLPEFWHLPRLGSPHHKTREGVLHHRIALCAGLVALSVTAATTALAQTYLEPPPATVGPPPAHGAPPPPAYYAAPPAAHGALPPNGILTIVRASGLRPLTQPARQGAHYVVLASDNMGGQLRVV